MQIQLVPKLETQSVFSSLELISGFKTDSTKILVGIFIEIVAN